ncbi:MAG: prolipoprotein diacylglyceryl transferase [Clostridia bacterium]|nr:prolipoprotein diacylglyceryl transferase [Clostridia bacterium]
MSVYEGILFGIKFKINPVAFTLPIGDGWDIYWYGIMIGLGFLAALIYAFYTAKRYEIDVDRMLDVALVTTPLAILCARAYYVIFDGNKLESFADFFGLGNGHGVAGLAIYGGVIGAFLFGGLACKWRKVNILDMFDLTATCFILAQGIGRWGNFFNQEAYGTSTGSSWWGMTSNQIMYQTGSAELVHPCFLYEFIWCIIGFIIIDRIGRNRKFKGQLVLSYGIWYGFGRGFIEQLRTDSLYIGSIRVSALLSFTVAIAFGILMYRILKKQKTVDENETYSNMFVSENETDDETTVENEQNDEVVEENEQVEEVIEENDENGEDN